MGALNALDNFQRNTNPTTAFLLRNAVRMLQSRFLEKITWEDEVAPEDHIDFGTISEAAVELLERQNDPEIIELLPNLVAYQRTARKSAESLLKYVDKLAVNVA